MSELSPDERIEAVQREAESVALGEKIAEISENASETASWIKAILEGPVGLAELAAENCFSKLGEWLAEQSDSAENLADALDWLGMDRIGDPGPDGPHPATVGDQVAHSYALLGFLGGLVIGALAAVAVGAAIVLSGGAAAVALIGAAAAGGLYGTFYDVTLTGALSQFGYQIGPIVTGSEDVFIEGRAASRLTDTAACMDHAPKPSPIIEGSETIYINRLPLARVGHHLLCGAVIDEGAKSVKVDRTTIAIAKPASEIPVWLRVVVDWMDFLPGINKPKSKSNNSNPSPSKPPASKPPEAKPPASKPPEAKPQESKPPESKPPESKPPEAKPPEAKPESKPPEAKPESKPPEAKPESKPPEAKPPESKSPEAKPPEAKPPESKPPEAKPPEAKPPEAKPPKPPESKPESKPPESKPPESKPTTVPKVPSDPSKSPGEGYEWRGRGEPGSNRGSWYNPQTGESLHPDLNHGPPIGPHWDYVDPNGKPWRVFPDGRMEPK